MGRGHDSDVRISDISVSRTHAIINLIKGNFYLEDNMSKFGTLVQMKRPIIVDAFSNFSLQSGRSVVNFTLNKQWKLFSCLCCCKDGSEEQQQQIAQIEQSMSVQDSEDVIEYDEQEQFENFAYLEESKQEGQINQEHFQQPQERIFQEQFSASISSFPNQQQSSLVQSGLQSQISSALFRSQQNTSPPINYGNLQNQNQDVIENQLQLAQNQEMRSGLQNQSRSPSLTPPQDQNSRLNRQDLRNSNQHQQEEVKNNIVSQQENQVSQQIQSSEMMYYEQSSQRDTTYPIVQNFELSQRQNVFQNMEIREIDSQNANNSIISIPQNNSSIELQKNNKDLQSK